MVFNFSTNSLKKPISFANWLVRPWSGKPVLTLSGKRPKSCLRVMASTVLHLGRSQLSSLPSYPSTRVWTSNVERPLILTVSGRKRYFFYHQPRKMQININRKKVSRYFNSNLTISADLLWIHRNARETPPKRMQNRLGPGVVSKCDGGLFGGRCSGNHCWSGNCSLSFQSLSFQSLFIVFSIFW